MDLEEWPLKKFNLFAIPIAIGLAIFADSFWYFLMIAAGVGFIIANVMATLYVGKFKNQLKQANPLLKFSVKLQGGDDSSLHIRFIFMQSLSGALIAMFRYGAASGIVYLVG